VRGFVGAAVAGLVRRAPLSGPPLPLDCAAALRALPLLLCAGAGGPGVVAVRRHARLSRSPLPVVTATVAAVANVRRSPTGGVCCRFQSQRLLVLELLSACPTAAALHGSWWPWLVLCAGAPRAGTAWPYAAECAAAAVLPGEAPWTAFQTVRAVSPPRPTAIGKTSSPAQPVMPRTSDITFAAGATARPTVLPGVKLALAVASMSRC
jgi:hypothetical protein